MYWSLLSTQKSQLGSRAIDNWVGCPTLRSFTGGCTNLRHVCAKMVVLAHAMCPSVIPCDMHPLHRSVAVVSRYLAHARRATLRLIPIGAWTGDLSPPQPLESYHVCNAHYMPQYSRAYYRATWISTALDAGFATAMTIRPRVLKDFCSVVFSLYYLVYANEADEKVCLFAWHWAVNCELRCNAHV